MLKNKTALSLSPLALLTLAACGGTEGTTNADGSVQNGPLQDAFAFLDLHIGATNKGDGIYNAATEQGILTDADGGYSLALPASGSYTFVANTTDATVDTLTGTAYGAGVTFKAPAGATKITPQTTMIESIVAGLGRAITDADIATAGATVVTAMGLPAGTDLTTYDPYAAGADASLALSVQQANNNVMSVVKTMSSAAEGAGMTAAAASKMAFDGMLASVNLGVALDFVTGIDAIMTKQTDAFNTYAAANTGLGLDTTEFATVATSAKAKIKDITTDIKALTTSSTAADKANLFKVIGQLSETVETYSKAVKDNGSATLTFDVAAAKANAAPTDIKIAGSTTTGTYSATSAETVAFVENTDSLAVGVLSAVDADQGATALTYTIVGGADKASFGITTDGAGVATLNFLAAPDYETKTSYVVTVSAKDSAGASKNETFTVTITDDTTEGGFYGISSDIITFTDYDPAGSGTDITNTMLTATSGTSVAIGTGATQVNLTNLSNHVNSSFVGTSKSPTLKFTVDSVPTGTGVAKIKVMITDGTDMTRSSGEDQIGIEVDVKYTTNSAGVSTISVPAQTATGSYNKGDGSAASTFSVANIGEDSFSLTKDVENDPSSATNFEVKLGNLYDAFVNGAGKADLLAAGTYNVAIETTLPLYNEANKVVTQFMANVELVASSAATRLDTLTGTDGADTLSGTNTGQIVDAGMGKDAITLGTGDDYVVLAAGDGNAASASANTVTNFTDGKDTFLLQGGLAFGDLTIAEGDTVNDTIISIKAVAAYGSTAAVAEEFLMHVTGVEDTDITSFDFSTVIS
jgi:hypothetical protein